MNFRQICTGIIFTLFLGAVFISAQSREPLATANGQTFNADDLSSNGRQLYDQFVQLPAMLRTQELADSINDALLEEEAKFRKITVDKLIDLEVTRKVPNPPETELQALYNANRAQLGNSSYAEVRPQLLRYLRNDPESKALESLIAALKKKYKITPGVDVNSPSLKPTDVLATVGTQKIIAGDFNEKVKPLIYRQSYQVFSTLDADLEKSIYNTLVLAEARNVKLEPEDLLAREITNKVAETPGNTPDELEAALRARLWKKYDVRILMMEPEPPVQKISTDDDPAQGSATAPVTVVVFSDFQCPVCSAVHPMVKDVVAGYGGEKVRLVMRDFPLTSIHDNAQKAAEAAGAANAQGKFFEYIDLLYANQKALDNASLKKYATDLKLDRVKFDAELDKGVYAGEIKKDVADGEAYGVPGTPTIFINGMRLMVNSPEAMKKLIDRVLAQKSSVTK
jgi:protein-disulfide isomerase